VFTEKIYLSEKGSYEIEVIEEWKKSLISSLIKGEIPLSPLFKRGE